MAMIPVGRDDRILLIESSLHANDDGFLTNIEMAEPANQAHAIHLAGLLLKTAYLEHIAIELAQFVHVVIAVIGSFSRR